MKKTKIMVSAFLLLKRMEGGRFVWLQKRGINVCSDTRLLILSVEEEPGWTGSAGGVA
jgi:hypothetical protein